MYGDIESTKRNSYGNSSYTFIEDVEPMTIDNGRNYIPHIYYCTFTESRKSRQPVFENYESQLASS